MENIIFCLTIFGFCGFALIVFIITTKKIVIELQKEKQDLLNRLMAKDYKEYAVFEHNKEVLKKETVAQKIMTPDLDVYRVD